MKDYGNAIKYLRKKHQMTQTTLAEKLNISGQAVSKWENNLAQPDLDTILNITEIFNITLDEFTKLCSSYNLDATLNDDENETSNFEKENTQTNMFIGVCSDCGLSIYKEDEVGERFPKLICKACKENKEKLKEEKKQEERRQAELSIINIKKHNKSKLIRTLIIPAIILCAIFALSLIITLTNNYENKQDTILGWCVITILIYLMVVQVKWDNNAVADIFDWTYHRVIGMPRLIIPLSIGGIIWAICVKIALFFIGILISILLSIIGIIICILISPFIFPFSLIKIIRAIKVGEKI